MSAQNHHSVVVSKGILRKSGESPTNDVPIKRAHSMMKTAKTGAKIIFPIKERPESGIPHHKRIGAEKIYDVAFTTKRENAQRVSGGAIFFARSMAFS